MRVQGATDHMLCGSVSRQQADLHCDGALLGRGSAGAAAEGGQGHDRAESGPGSGLAHPDCPHSHPSAAHHPQVDFVHALMTVLETAAGLHHATHASPVPCPFPLCCRSG